MVRAVNAPPSLRDYSLHDWASTAVIRFPVALLAEFSRHESRPTFASLQKSFAPPRACSSSRWKAADYWRRCSASTPAARSWSGSPAWQADAPPRRRPTATRRRAATRERRRRPPIDMTHASLPAGTPMALFQTERFDKADGADMLLGFPRAAGPVRSAAVFRGNLERRLQQWSAHLRRVDRRRHRARTTTTCIADVGANKGVMKSFVVTSDCESRHRLLSRRCRTRRSRESKF